MAILITVDEIHAPEIVFNVGVNICVRYKLQESGLIYYKIYRCNKCGQQKVPQKVNCKVSQRKLKFVSIAMWVHSNIGV